MTDVSEAALDNGRLIINKSLTRIARKAHPNSEADQKALIAKVFDNVETTTSGEEAVRDTDLVVEAIVENLDTKIKLFGHLDSLAPSDAIFASNTSSLSIAAIASACSDGRKARFAGFHAFNPVPAMKLVEVVSVEGVTTDETTEALLGLCTTMGKTPVRCKDTPG
jgi:3-hydroxyacyl-CoA dehydrogenase